MSTPRSSFVVLVPLAFFVVFAALAATAHGDLAEPPKNQGATQVRVEGTRVEAEAWAVAHGREVEALVVTRMVPVPGKAPKIETYERWSLDGRKKFERGSRALGKAWEKHVWALLDEMEPGKGKVRRKPKELLGRLLKGYGRGGTAVVGEWVVGWSVGQGTTAKDGRKSVGRTAVFTFTPAPRRPDATPRPGDTPGQGDVTPRRDEPAPQGGGSEKAPAPREEEGERPVTPRAKPRPAPPWPWPEGHGRGGPGGFSGGFGSGSGMGQADSEKGVRQHARVDVDLRTVRPPPPRAPEPERPPVTPRKR